MTEHPICEQRVDRAPCGGKLLPERTGGERWLVCERCGWQVEMLMEAMVNGEATDGQGKA